MRLIPPTPMLPEDALALPDAELCRFLLAPPHDGMWAFPRPNGECDIGDTAAMARLLRAEVAANPGAFASHLIDTNARDRVFGPPKPLTFEDVRAWGAR